LRISGREYNHLLKERLEFWRYTLISSTWIADIGNWIKQLQNSVLNFDFPWPKLVSSYTVCFFPLHLISMASGELWTCLFSSNSLSKEVEFKTLNPAKWLSKSYLSHASCETCRWNTRQGAYENSDGSIRGLPKIESSVDIIIEVSLKRNVRDTETYFKTRNWSLETQRLSKLV
jgi:hypothetical protein